MVVVVSVVVSVPSLGVIPFRESSNTPNLTQEGPKNPYIYIGISPNLLGVPRSAPECPGSQLKPLPAKNQSFATDNMPHEAFRGRITPNFDNSLLFCLFFQKKECTFVSDEGNKP